MEGFLYAKHIGFSTRLNRIGLVVAVIAGILVLRLFQLQIIRGDRYRTLSDNNRYRLQRLNAPRGMILDRNGEVLVDNRPAFALSAVPREMDDPERTVRQLAGLVAIDLEKAVSDISALRRSSTSMAMHVTVKEDLPFHEVARTEEAIAQLPGVIIVSRPVRRYVFNEAASTVLGYLGEIDERQLEQFRERGYTLGSLIGKTGIERVCEEHLRGVDGGLLVEVHSLGKPQLVTDFRGREQFQVDSLGRQLRTEYRRDPEPGNNVTLTIDRRIQQLAETALGDATGAIVVMDMDTGEVLALASKPAYDPNIFVGTGNDAQIKELLNDPRHPLLSRAYQGNYPPGSTVKPIMAVAALEEGAITPQTQLACSGSYDMGRPFRCWRKNGHGVLTVVDALAHSCDVFFYQVGQRLGPRAIARYFNMFGLGESTGLGLPGEETGFVPTVEWKQRRFRQQWYAGDTANFSIGQGTMLATPVQMARAFAALANGGHLVRPQLVRSVVSGSGAVIYSFDSAGSEPLTIKQATCDVVTQGLRKAVQQDTFPTGTGYRAKVQGIDIIGKTGTAQVVQKKPGEDGVVDINTIPYEYRDHAWFVCLVMDKQPRIVVSVLKEHSGHGGDVSAPVAGALIRAIYTGEEIAVPQVVAAAPGSVGAPQASGERETSF